MESIDSEKTLSRRSLIKGMTALALSMTGVLGLAQKKGAKWADKFELLIELEIDQPEGRRYHRPYVAVWISDIDGKSIRTLSLWVQTTGRGPRWIPDLRSWFRGETARKEADGGDLVATVSGATRMPGKYSVIWDGKNDKGKLVDQGVYVVNIESAREHGTYQLIRKELTLGTKPLTETLTNNIEIKGARVEYRKRK